MNTIEHHRVAYALQFYREDTQAKFSDRWHQLLQRARFADEAVDHLDELAP